MTSNIVGAVTHRDVLVVVIDNNTIDNALFDGLLHNLHQIELKEELTYVEEERSEYILVLT